MYDFKSFTAQEIDILIESLDEWVTKDFSSQLMGGLIQSVFANGLPPEKKAEMEEKQRADDEKRKTARRLRQEQAIVMKAKLLQVRDSMDAGMI